MGRAFLAAGGVCANVMKGGSPSGARAQMRGVAGAGSHNVIGHIKEFGLYSQPSEKCSSRGWRTQIFSFKSLLGSGVGRMGCTRRRGEVGDQFRGSYNCPVEEGRLGGCHWGHKEVGTVCRDS